MSADSIVVLAYLATFTGGSWLLAFLFGLHPKFTSRGETIFCELIMNSLWAISAVCILAAYIVATPNAELLLKPETVFAALCAISFSCTAFSLAVLIVHNKIEPLQYHQYGRFIFWGIWGLTVIFRPFALSARVRTAISNYLAKRRAAKTARKAANSPSKPFVPPPRTLPPPNCKTRSLLPMRNLPPRVANSPCPSPKHPIDTKQNNQLQKTTKAMTEQPKVSSPQSPTTTHTFWYTFGAGTPLAHYIQPIVVEDPGDCHPLDAAKRGMESFYGDHWMSCFEKDPIKPNNFFRFHLPTIHIKRCQIWVEGV